MSRRHIPDKSAIAVKVPSPTHDRRSRNFALARLWTRSVARANEREERIEMVGDHLHHNKLWKHLWRGQQFKNQNILVFRITRVSEGGESTTEFHRNPDGKTVILISGENGARPYHLESMYSRCFRCDSRFLDDIEIVEYPEMHTEVKLLEFL
jgi:hypothetical protein